MDRQFNPIIHDHTTDTLAHTRDVLTLLQVVFSSSEITSTEYERSSHLGIYWVLEFCRHALKFEMERID
jgi:hypothetical protein